MHKVWTITAIVALVIAVLIGGGYLYMREKISRTVAPLTYSITDTSYAALTASNTDFVTAEARSKAGDSVGAIEAYQDALAKATDSVQIGQIKFKIAYEEKKLSNYQLAIQDLKAIVADANNTPVLRAYAIQQIGMIYRDQGAAVAPLIFGDEPYKSMAVGDDAELTQRHIFDAAIATYPKLAVSELYVANWYATQLELAADKSITLTSDDASSYLSEAETHIANANENLPFLQSDPNMSALYPTALTLKASVEGTLAVLGQYSRSDATNAFVQAIAYYQLQSDPTLDGYARYQYARFLQKIYGKQSATQIKDILAPLTTPAYAKAEIMDLLRAARTGSPARIHSILRLAALDPDFKTLLSSLGWTAEQLKPADSYVSRSGS